MYHFSRDWQQWFRTERWQKRSAFTKPNVSQGTLSSLSDYFQVWALSLTSLAPVLARILLAQFSKTLHFNIWWFLLVILYHWPPTWLFGYRSALVLLVFRVQFDLSHLRQNPIVTVRLNKVYLTIFNKYHEYICLALELGPNSAHKHRHREGEAEAQTAPAMKAFWALRQGVTPGCGLACAAGLEGRWSQQHWTQRTWAC